MIYKYMLQSCRAACFVYKAQIQKNVCRVMLFPSVSVSAVRESSGVVGNGRSNSRKRLFVYDVFLKYLLSVGGNGIRKCRSFFAGDISEQPPG